MLIYRVLAACIFLSTHANALVTLPPSVHKSKKPQNDKTFSSHPQPTFVSLPSLHKLSKVLDQNYTHDSIESMEPPHPYSQIESHYKINNLKEAAEHLSRIVNHSTHPLTPLLTTRYWALLFHFGYKTEAEKLATLAQEHFPHVDVWRRVKCVHALLRKDLGEAQNLWTHTPQSPTESPDLFTQEIFQAAINGPVNLAQVKAKPQIMDYDAVILSDMVGFNLAEAFQDPSRSAGVYNIKRIFKDPCSLLLNHIIASSPFQALSLRTEHMEELAAQSQNFPQMLSAMLKDYHVSMKHLKDLEKLVNFLSHENDYLMRQHIKVSRLRSVLKDGFMGKPFAVDTPSPHMMLAPLQSYFPKGTGSRALAFQTLQAVNNDKAKAILIYEILMSVHAENGLFPPNAHPNLYFAYLKLLGPHIAQLSPQDVPHWFLPIGIQSLIYTKNFSAATLWLNENPSLMEANKINALAHIWIHELHLKQEAEFTLGDENIKLVVSALGLNKQHIPMFSPANGAYFQLDLGCYKPTYPHLANVVSDDRVNQEQLSLISSHSCLANDRLYPLYFSLLLRKIAKHDVVIAKDLATEYIMLSSPLKAHLPST
jgi:hypothetical protein